MARLAWRSPGVLAFGLLALPACFREATRGGGYCAPPEAPSFSLDSDELPPAGAPREASLAALLGVSAASAQHALLSSDVRIHVVERLEVASLAIEATSAELECEAERARQAAQYLSGGQASSVQALTIASIAAATLTGIAGVLLSTNGRSAAEQDTVAISGGVVTASLGLGSLFVHPRVKFEHSRNLLADVWLGPSTSTTYPPLVWAYITRPEFSNSGRVPIRERIVARWRQFRQLDDPLTAAALFGSGGSYDADALRSRAAMLDEVKAEVDLAHQDLAAFAATLLRSKG
jgi:hypothetical protein